MEKEIENGDERLREEESKRGTLTHRKRARDKDSGRWRMIEREKEGRTDRQKDRYINT